MNKDNERQLHLLTAAREEIVSLRQGNAVLSAQVGVIEVFAAALGLRRNGGGMALDIVNSLNVQIAALEAAASATEEKQV